MKYGPIFLALGFLVGGSGLLAGAWALETSSDSINTVVVETNGENLFAVRLEPRDRPTILIHCDEEHFQEAFSKFAQFLDVDVEPIVIPGGIMALSYAPDTVPEAFEAVRRTAVELLKRYSPEQLIVIAHSECLVYDAIAAWQDDLERVRQSQDNDLTDAVSFLNEWLPSTSVDVYYAVRDGNQLRFNPWKGGG